MTTNTYTEVNANINYNFSVNSNAKISMTLLRAIIVFIIIAILPIAANAHALKETSARIILRDGQVEVRILTDFKRWQTHLQNNQAWLLGDIKQIMPFGLTTKETKVFVAKLLNEEMILTMHNQSIPLTLNTISVPKNNTEHHEYTELVLTAKHAFVLVGKVNIRFPKSLGAVHASFVKPKYQLVQVGDSAQVSF